MRLTFTIGELDIAIYDKKRFSLGRRQFRGLPARCEQAPDRCGQQTAKRDLPAKPA